MSVLVDFSVVPIGQGVSLSGYVARVTRIVQASGLPNSLHAMGTEIEAETFADAARVIDRCIAELLTDCQRVTAQIKVDCRPGRSNLLTEKIASVRRKMGGQ